MGPDMMRSIHSRRFIAAATTALLVLSAVSATGQTRPVKPEELRLAGNPNAPVKIEVFSDFQCPHCRDFYLGTLKPLIADFTRSNRLDKIYVVYHDYPLEMHPFARKAARYALAAYRVGRERWLRVTDALYTDQARWSVDGNIEPIISRALPAADMARVRKLAAEPSIDAAVGVGIMFAQSRNIDTTPTSFIVTETGRQQRFTGVLDPAVLKDYIDRLLR